ncbi:hypothetical protein PAPYR_1514 [Paratrimastix pyriformis]|uniref:EGF-like domain-containing protein n=1 Tax=Paratrimastix pyriformis TaxID=342808 RepID=A0ABQ8UW96_9EUKA|nr:hypothetical protein PAPYR_1514 [Paratrimastix pyriformis]
MPSRRVFRNSCVVPQFKSTISMWLLFFFCVSGCLSLSFISPRQGVVYSNRESLLVNVTCTPSEELFFHLLNADIFVATQWQGRCNADGTLFWMWAHPSWLVSSDWNITITRTADYQDIVLASVQFATCPNAGVINVTYVSPTCTPTYCSITFHWEYPCGGIQPAVFLLYGVQSDTPAQRYIDAFPELPDRYLDTSHGLSGSETWDLHEAFAAVGYALTGPSFLLAMVDQAHPVRILKSPTFALGACDLQVAAVYPPLVPGLAFVAHWGVSCMGMPVPIYQGVRVALYDAWGEFLDNISTASEPISGSPPRPDLWRLNDFSATFVVSFVPASAPLSVALRFTSAHSTDPISLGTGPAVAYWDTDSPVCSVKTCSDCLLSTQCYFCADQFPGRCLDRLTPCAHPVPSCLALADRTPHRQSVDSRVHFNFTAYTPALYPSLNYTTLDGQIRHVRLPPVLMHGPLGGADFDLAGVPEGPLTFSFETADLAHRVMYHGAACLAETTPRLLEPDPSGFHNQWYLSLVLNSSDPSQPPPVPAEVRSEHFAINCPHIGVDWDTPATIPLGTPTTIHWGSGCACLDGYDISLVHGEDGLAVNLTTSPVRDTMGHFLAHSFAWLDLVVTVPVDFPLGDAQFVAVCRSDGFVARDETEVVPCRPALVPIRTGYLAFPSSAHPGGFFTLGIELVCHPFLVEPATLELSTQQDGSTTGQGYAFTGQAMPLGRIRLPTDMPTGSYRARVSYDNRTEIVPWEQYIEILYAHKLEWLQRLPFPVNLSLCWDTCGPDASIMNIGTVNPHREGFLRCDPAESGPQDIFVFRVAPLDWTSSSSATSTSVILTLTSPLSWCVGYPPPEFRALQGPRRLVGGQPAQFTWIARPPDSFLFMTLQLVRSTTLEPVVTWTSVDFSKGYFDAIIPEGLTENTAHLLATNPVPGLRYLSPALYSLLPVVSRNGVLTSLSEADHPPSGSSSYVALPVAGPFGFRLTIPGMECRGDEVRPATTPQIDLTNHAHRHPIPIFDELCSAWYSLPPTGQLTLVQTTFYLSTPGAPVESALKFEASSGKSICDPADFFRAAYLFNFEPSPPLPAGFWHVAAYNFSVLLGENDFHFYAPSDLDLAHSHVQWPTDVTLGANSFITVDAVTRAGATIRCEAGAVTSQSVFSLLADADPLSLATGFCTPSGSFVLSFVAQSLGWANMSLCAAGRVRGVEGATSGEPQRCVHQFLQTLDPCITPDTPTCETCAARVACLARNVPRVSAPASASLPHHPPASPPQIISLFSHPPCHLIFPIPHLVACWVVARILFPAGTCLHDCSGHGICQATGGLECKCDHGWYGTDCSRRIHLKWGWYPDGLSYVDSPLILGEALAHDPVTGRPRLAVLDMIRGLTVVERAAEGLWEVVAQQALAAVDHQTSLVAWDGVSVVLCSVTTGALTVGTLVERGLGLEILWNPLKDFIYTMDAPAVGEVLLANGTLLVTFADTFRTSTRNRDGTFTSHMPAPFRPLSLTKDGRYLLAETLVGSDSELIILGWNSTAGIWDRVTYDLPIISCRLDWGRDYMVGSYLRGYTSGHQRLPCAAFSGHYFMALTPLGEPTLKNLEVSLYRLDGTLAQAPLPWHLVQTLQLDLTHSTDASANTEIELFEDGLVGEGEPLAILAPRPGFLRKATQPGHPWRAYPLVDNDGYFTSLFTEMPAPLAAVTTDSLALRLSGSGHYQFFTRGRTCPNACLGDRGTCDHSTGRCHCHDGFTGDDCSEPLCPGDCNGAGGGICDPVTRTCACNLGYAGPDCTSIDDAYMTWDQATEPVNLVPPFQLEGAQVWSFATGGGSEATMKMRSLASLAVSEEIAIVAPAGYTFSTDKSYAFAIYQSFLTLAAAFENVITFYSATDGGSYQPAAPPLVLGTDFRATQVLQLQSSPITVVAVGLGSSVPIVCTYESSLYSRILGHVMGLGSSVPIVCTYPVQSRLDGRILGRVMCLLSVHRVRVPPLIIADVAACLRPFECCSLCKDLPVAAAVLIIAFGPTCAVTGTSSIQPHRIIRLHVLQPPLAAPTPLLPVPVFFLWSRTTGRQHTHHLPDPAVSPAPSPARLPVVGSAPPVWGCNTPTNQHAPVAYPSDVHVSQAAGEWPFLAQVTRSLTNPTLTLWRLSPLPARRMSILLTTPPTGVRYWNHLVFVWSPDTFQGIHINDKVVVACAAQILVFDCTFDRPHQLRRQAQPFIPGRSPPKDSGARPVWRAAFTVPMGGLLAYYAVGPVLGPAMTIWGIDYSVARYKPAKREIGAGAGFWDFGLGAEASTASRASRASRAATSPRVIAKKAAFLILCTSFFSALDMAGGGVPTLSARRASVGLFPLQLGEQNMAMLRIHVDPEDVDPLTALRLQFLDAASTITVLSIADEQMHLCRLPEVPCSIDIFPPSLRAGDWSLTFSLFQPVSVTVEKFTYGL